MSNVSVVTKLPVQNEELVQLAVTLEAFVTSHGSKTLSRYLNSIHESIMAFIQSGEPIDVEQKEAVEDLHEFYMLCRGLTGIDMSRALKAIYDLAGEEVLNED